jgi:hypothetical protein
MIHQAHLTRVEFIFGAQAIHDACQYFGATWIKGSLCAL